MMTAQSGRKTDTDFMIKESQPKVDRWLAHMDHLASGITKVKKCWVCEIQNGVRWQPKSKIIAVIGEDYGIARKVRH